MKRIFLVGAPRSGTTLLQSLLASHPEVISFPESKFFHYLLYNKFVKKFPDRLSAFFKDEINRPEFLQNFDLSQSTELKVSWFVGVLDGLAAEDRKSIWLEKTPEHIYFIKDIERFLPDAKFIHILRNGMDTIASLYEATRSSPELWGDGWDLDHCIKRWKEGVLISHKYVNDSHHKLVKYEDLLENKTKFLADICDFFGIEYDSQMLVNYKAKAANLSLNLPWHKGIERDIQIPNVHKYHGIFKSHEIQYILEKIKGVNSEFVYEFKVEVTEPISDISIPQIFDRLCCTIQLEGVKLGIVELPVCDGMVAGVVLADAIAAKFAWLILQRFFQHRAWESIHELSESSLSRLHRKLEWREFLQEIWDCPISSSDYFSNRTLTIDEASIISLTQDLIAVEVSAELPNIQVDFSEIDVLVKVGGVPIGIVTVAVEHNLVSAEKLRSAITQNTNFELCVAAVREALLGKPLNGKMSLRSHLAASAQKMANAPDGLNAAGSEGIYPQNAVIFDRCERAIGTSASRRAALPVAALRELAEAATIAGEPIMQIPLDNELPKQVIYAPEIMARNSPYKEVSQLTETQVFHNQTVNQKLPIFAYRRISPNGLNAVTPQVFEQQLQRLKNKGYYSVSWSSLQSAKLTKTALPGKPVLLTFDGGYLDFFEYAFPLLKQFDFTATVFVVTDSIGKTNSWEKADSEAVQLMGWPELIQLRNAGMDIGSLSATYQPLTGLSPTEIVREGAKSRAILERGLGKSVKCFAYPYGSVDQIVEHLIGSVGYTFGVSYGLKFSSFADSLLSLPRMQVTAANFRKLGL
ncbi:sulfotransferase [Microcoleus anatoxicus]|uniref:sulfotransferase n=1 Tax=Microcoleus anatoxicus TaxID=2705319 RepID=UPI0030C8DF0C